jgi:hypothetical protein
VKVSQEILRRLTDASESGAISMEEAASLEHSYKRACDGSESGSVGKRIKWQTTAERIVEKIKERIAI